MKVLFICTGNTCRSPLAEVYLKKERPEWMVSSAGAAATSGSPASENACRVAAELGLDLSEHRSRAFEDVLPEEFDCIYAMSASHLKVLPEGCDGSLLSSVKGESRAVKDPYGGDLSTYRRAFCEIREYLGALLCDNE